MSHDIQADWAAAELARHFKETPSNCFINPPAAETISAYAVKEGKTSWPFTDGVVKIESGTKAYNVALEYKRTNEGLHGVLTALGQGNSYIYKGFAGAVIVLPGKYDTYDKPGDFARQVLEATSREQLVGVFTYEEPDPSEPSPFRGKLTCHRPLQIDLERTTKAIPVTGKRETQWAHVREGSTVPSAFYRYLQTAKRLATENEPELPTIPPELVAAVGRLEPGGDVIKYLSNAPGDSLHDKVWRHFWFNYVLTPEVMPIWVSPVQDNYEVNDVPTRLLRADGRAPMKFFSYRSDSIKKTVVTDLNNEQIDEDAAWEMYAENINERAHSFREDVDSGLEHLGLLGNDGRPTDIGYRFVDACERTGDPNSGTPIAILGAALLKNGRFAAFLHYIYKLSEKKFKYDPLAFTRGSINAGTLTFDRRPYLNWLRDELADNLRVLRRGTPRGGVAAGTERRPFQSELRQLRYFDFARDFRIGLGLEVNWPAVQEAMNFPI